MNIVDQVTARQQLQHSAEHAAGVHERACLFVQLICEREMYAAADMLTDELRSARGASVTALAICDVFMFSTT